MLAALGLLGALALGGCASTPPAATPGATASAAAAAPAAQPVNPIDPWEHWNRKVYAFNDAIDRAVLKPAAQGYRAAVPHLVRRGVDNVLGNIGDIWSAANNLLQGKVQTGLEMGMRVLTNTFFGLGGLLDPATEMRLTRHSEDFGQTLGVWGVASGPFVELPLFGPSTVRDGLALIADRRASAARLPETAEGRNAVTAVDIVSTRARFLDAGDLVDRVALDPYAFIRDAYLAHRRESIRGGAPAMDTFSDVGDDSPPPAAAASAAAPASAASAPAAAAPALPAAPASAPQ
ncbi:MAG: VacJ family lipoprotein [Burkholderiales bacterium]|nr:VacJ family lipoprotein [Burkholderiales bacterium]